MSKIKLKKGRTYFLTESINADKINKSDIVDWDISTKLNSMKPGKYQYIGNGSFVSIDKKYPASIIYKPMTLDEVQILFEEE